MTQIATVEKKLGAGYVEISVPRKSACGHDCEECAGCGMTGAAIRARAEDPVGVSAGEKGRRRTLRTRQAPRRGGAGIRAAGRGVPAGVFPLAGSGPRVCAMPSPWRGGADVRADVAYDRYARRLETLTYTVVRRF